MKPLPKFPGLLLLLWVLCISASAQVRKHSKETNPEPLAKAIVKQKQEEPVTLPVGVSQDWYEHSVDQIQKREYFIQSLNQPANYVAANSKQRLGFMFTPEGYSVRNITGDEKDRPWQSDFQFKGIVRSGQTPLEQKLTAARNQENTLEYDYTNYTVQYINDVRGMRQNFIVKTQLPGKGNLEVLVDLAGDLEPKMKNNGHLVMYDGKIPQLIYDEIKVWDATNRPLAASMRIHGDNHLILSVDDENAVYPLTIDPLNHAPNWTDSGSGLVFSLLDDLSAPLLYGFSVSGAGDLNGDGYDDVVIGAPAYVDVISVSGGTFNTASVGAAFIYFGSASGLSANPAEILQPTSEVGALFGFSVSGAGDVNGDGRADVVVGAPGDKVSVTVGLGTVNVAVGKVYIYYGTQFDGNINTEPTVAASVSLKQSDLGVLLTTPINALYGFSVSSAGDVNGDGKSDIVVGSPAYIDLLSLNLAGRVDVYHGSASGIGASPSRTITGGLLNGLFGYTVSTAGKVNNDSYDDIIVGAPASINLIAVGAAYVFHGSATGITATSASAANTSLNAPGLLSKTLFGYSVSAAGDVNADGRGDVIIGEPLALDLFSGSLVAVGRAHIFYGSTTGIQSNARTQLTSPRKPGLLGLITGNLLFGFSVSGVKDINCDGVDDVIIGEPGGTSLNLGTGLLGLVSTNAVSGQAYIFYGKNSTGPIDNPGYTYFQSGAISAANLIGYSVKSSGDVNGDGKPDFLIGAPNGTLNLSSSLTGILGNTLGYLTTNSVGSTYGFHGCINSLPVAVNDVATTNEDTPVIVNVTANDTDADGSINTATVDLNTATAGIQNTITTAAGTWTVNAAGEVTYTPALNYNGSASISYNVKDNSGAVTNNATLTVTVVPVNDLPVAVNDNTTTPEDTPVILNIVANDTDVDGTIDAATVDLDPATVGTQGSFTNSSGTWSVSAGILTFAPAHDFNGAATVSYTVKDNEGGTSNAATVAITVMPVNDAPVAVNDNVITAEDTPVLFSVTANDTDVDGTIDAATVDLNPLAVGTQNTLSNTSGTWSVNPTGNVTYTPALDFNGTASITYTVKDNSGTLSNIATISVTVTPINDAPIAVNDTPSTPEDTPVVFNVTLNDTDVDGNIDPATVDLNPATAGIQNTITNASGTWTVDATGNVTYTPTANFNGNASISYVVKDDSGTLSNTATITVSVIPVNDAPVAVNDTPSTNEDTPASFSVVVNDTDIDGTINPATVDLNPSLAGIQSTLSNASGSWSANASGSVTYTPALNFNGPAIITYTVNDNSGATSNVATITVTVNPVNDAPVAVNDNQVTNEDTPVAFSIVANDSDIDGTIDAATVDLDPSTGGIQSTLTTTTGTWSVNTSGLLTYTPVLNFNGSTSITYTVRDNSGTMSNVATISVTVNSVNDAPVAVNDNLSGGQNTPLTFNVTANDKDVDGTIDPTTVDLDPATAGTQSTFNNAAGNWSVDASGNVTFTPLASFTGTSSITYTVKDNSGTLSNAGTISVNIFAVAPANVAPVAVNDNSSTNQNVAVTFNVTANDTDSDGTINAASVDLDLATAGVQNNFVTAAGTWNVISTGYLTFTPTAVFFGTASLSYKVNDNSGTPSNAATISVAVNAAPVAVNDSPVTNEDTPVTFSVTANDTDADGPINTASVDLDPATAGLQNTLTTAAGTWTVNVSGNVTFTPVLNFNGNPSITYTIKDGNGATSNVATISVTVTPVNDAPVAVNDNSTTNEDNLVSFSVTVNDTDVDGSINVATVDLDQTTAGIQATKNTTAGSWSVNATGTVTFTPALNFNGTASITYTVNDNGSLTSNVATISVTVNPVNDAPVAVNDTPVTDEDTPIVFNVTLNDTDVDGTIDDSTVDLNPALGGIQTSITNAGGTWSVDVNGNVTYTPAVNFTGPASVTYTVKDNSGTVSNTGTITVTVTPVNDAPVAVNDNIATPEDVAITINIVANDTDVDGTINATTVDLDPALAGIQSMLANASGSWTANATGSIVFTPVADFNGAATATYTVNDNSGATSNIATITVTVTPVNDAPVAINDNPVTNEDTAITFSVVANDTDADGTIDAATVDLDPITAGIQTSFTNLTGNWVVSPTGNVTFTPALNFHGTGSITYEVNDNSGLTSNTATISVTVNSVNDAPVAVNDNLITDANVSITFHVTTNDTDVDGTIDASTIDLDPIASGIQTIITSALKGVWEVNTAGAVTFTPVLGFFGSASIDYTVKDNEGALSNTATIAVTVNWVNTSPVALDDSESTEQGKAVSFNIALNDLDVDANLDLTSIHLIATPGSSARSFLSADGSWDVSITGQVTFQPNADFVGLAIVKYTITDIMGLISNEAEVKVTVTPAPKNDFITGLAKSVSTPELQADGRSKLIFTFTAKNLGTEDANSIQITDDLTLAFPAPASYTIVSGSANGNLIFNTSFNGSGDTNLLATGSKLLAGTTQQVILTVLVNPNGKPGSFTNAALVTVKSDDNTVTYTDHSDEGTNPDSNGNGNPGDPGEDDSTVILLPSSPSVVVSKELAMEPVKKSDCTYDVTLKVMIKNTGNVDFISISLTDNLDMGIIAPADFTIINVISSDVQVNIGFDGKQDKNLLASGTPLHHGDSIEVVYTVNITPNDFFGPYFNIIIAKTTDANGTVSEYQSKSVEFHIVPQEVWIPEGFSPNGDGVHDLFEITLSCGLKAKLTVFNRWGERVYQSNDYQNDWGGQSNHGDFMDKLLPEGTYFFTCELSSGTKTTSFITIKN